jgi:hypothetical protein
MASYMARYCNEASPERPAAAVRSRLWPPFRINNLQDLNLSLRDAEAFCIFAKHLIFNELRTQSGSGPQKGWRRSLESRNLLIRKA